MFILLWFYFIDVYQFNPLIDCCFFCTSPTSASRFILSNQMDGQIVLRRHQQPSQWVHALGFKTLNVQLNAPLLSLPHFHVRQIWATDTHSRQHQHDTVPRLIFDRFHQQKATKMNTAGLARDCRVGRPTLAFLLWPPCFKTKTTFGFLIKRNPWFFYLFEKLKNELVRTKMMFLAILAKKWWFSDNSDV